jgi:hypothetical protein
MRRRIPLIIKAASLSLHSAVPSRATDESRGPTGELVCGGGVIATADSYIGSENGLDCGGSC